MKKHISTLLMLSWAFTLVACSGGQEAPKRNKDQQKEADKQEQRANKPRLPLLVVGALQLIYKVVKKK